MREQQQHDSWMACLLVFVSAVQVTVAKSGISEMQLPLQQQQQGCLLDQQEQLAEAICHHIDLQALHQLAATAAVPQPAAPLPPPPRSFRVSLGVACDEAFFSYFQQ